MASGLSAGVTAIGCGCSVGAQQLIGARRRGCVLTGTRLGGSDRVSVLVTSKAKSNEPTGGSSIESISAYAADLITDPGDKGTLCNLFRRSGK